MSISQQLVADYRKEAPLTRRLLEAVPSEHFDWKPHEKSMTLGQLAGHIAENQSWVDSMLVDDFDFATDAPDYRPFVPQSHEELMARFDETVDLIPEHFEGRDDEFMERIWTMRQGDHVIAKEPRHEAIRTFMIHHAAHHRGQLTVYLRLLDAKVPGIYGPTADDAPPS
ncbi:MAG: DinB family protein [Holophagales bacterium]|nr:DinB family protein [Holophagales bacterium]